MPTLRHLNSLQAVEAAVRCGSQKAAAEELGISPAAVGQRIRSLEDYLGTELLDRSRSGVVATPALRSAIECLAAGFASLSDAADLLRYSSHNTVRLQVEPDWAALWLQRRLPEFLEEHPHCEILIDPAPGVGGRHDLRISRCEHSTHGVHLYNDYLLPVCSPENFSRIVDLADGEKLEGFPLLHIEREDVPTLDWPGWVRRFGQRQTGADRGVRYQRVEPAVRATRSNVGMLLCGISLVEEQLREGELLLPFGPSPGAWDEKAYWLEAHAPALKRPSVRRFHEWLLLKVEEVRDSLEARVGAAPPQRSATHTPLNENRGHSS